MYVRGHNDFACDTTMVRGDYRHLWRREVHETGRFVDSHTRKTTNERLQLQNFRM